MQQKLIITSVFIHRTTSVIVGTKDLIINEVFYIRERKYGHFQIQQVIYNEN